MKRLLIAFALLSGTTCDIDVTEIKDVSTTSAERLRETPTRITGHRLWWSRGNRAPEYFLRSDANGNRSARPPRTVQSFVPSAPAVIRCLETNAQRRRDAASNADKSRGARRERLPESSKRRVRSVPCDPRIRYYRREREWKVQRPLSAEEPSWIEIDEDRAQILRRRDPLEGLDPFVISRGKKARGSTVGVGDGMERRTSTVDRAKPTLYRARDCEGRNCDRNARDETNLMRDGGTRIRKRRRTRLENRGAVLKDILTMSDPFYAARGKRILRSMDYSCCIKTNNFPLNGKTRKHDRMCLETNRFIIISRAI